MGVLFMATIATTAREPSARFLDSLERLRTAHTHPFLGNMELQLKRKTH